MIDTIFHTLSSSWHVLLFALLIGLSDGVVQVISHHISGTIFEGSQFWDPFYSWKNKYKDANYNLGPKFPGSTTIFVFITDAYHLLRAVQTVSWLFIVSFASTISSSVLVTISFILLVKILSFHLIYTVIFK
jgi:hypothetical protein